MQPRQILLRLGWLGTYVQSQHDDFADVVGKGNIPIIHDQDLLITEARLALDVGLTQRFAASLVLPLRIVSTTIVYRDGMGAPVQLTQPNIHHRDETLVGLADPMLLGAYSQALGGTRLTLRAGLSVPLGRTEEDPFTLGDMGIEHEHIQFGTGTFNPVVAVEASRGWGAWRFGAFAFTQQVVYENSKGYHAGDRYAAGISVRRALGTRWSVRGGPEFQAETAERWHGVKHTEEGNQGRVDFMLGAGAAWRTTDALTFDVAVKVPVYTHVVGGQLEVPAIVEVGASWSFGGTPRRDPHAGHDHAHGEHEEGDEHEHGDEHGEHEHGDHEHGDDHAHADAHEHADAHDAHAHDGHEHDGHAHDTPHVDTTGADVADVGANGQRVALVPVAGKLTIFDFWATWCEPCKKLEPVLVDIARQHPNVAIRRVEVIDWDSPVAEQHLTKGGFGLPHLKIYDAKGTLVLEESSAPGKLGELIDKVRRLAGPAPSQTPAPAAPPAPPVPSAPPASPAPSAPPANPAAPKPAAPKPVAPLRIDITVSERGFEPKDIKVPRNRPVVLRFRRTAAKTCATEVVFDHDGVHELKDLPLNTTVELPITFKQPGTIKFSCAMNMIGGTITVQ